MTSIYQVIDCVDLSLQGVNGEVNNTISCPANTPQSEVTCKVLVTTIDTETERVGRQTERGMEKKRREC